MKKLFGLIIVLVFICSCQDSTGMFHSSLFVKSSDSQTVYIVKQNGSISTSTKKSYRNYEYELKGDTVLEFNYFTISTGGKYKETPITINRKSGNGVLEFFLVKEDDFDISDYFFGRKKMSEMDWSLVKEKAFLKETLSENEEKKTVILDINKYGYK